MASAADTGDRKLLQQAGLHHVSDRQPGIRRLRSGKGFRYLDVRGRPLRDEAQLKRIRSLAIPPAYRDVWICPSPAGHLQATGYDSRGRKQYRYHPEWRRLRDEVKFGRMIDFGAALPRLRERLRRDLALPGLPRGKVLATVVKLLDVTATRIGNPQYARRNGSYGLTTLRNHHARIQPHGSLRLHFRGKGGQEHDLVLDDPRLARLVQRCKELPGQQLFQYLDENGQRHAVDSGEVNAYLAEAMGGPFSAKDFRTWTATTQALARLCSMPLPERGGERARRSCIQNVICRVAEELNNTPAVCRKSYINPLVFQAWESGRLGAARRRGGSPREAERRMLALLRRQRPRAPRRTQVKAG